MHRRLLWTGPVLVVPGRSHTPRARLSYHEDWICQNLLGRRPLYQITMEEESYLAQAYFPLSNVIPPVQQALFLLFLPFPFFFQMTGY